LDLYHYYLGDLNIKKKKAAHNTVHTPAHVLGKVVGAAGPLNKKALALVGKKQTTQYRRQTQGPAHALECCMQV
jgi:predicted Zn-dependent protease